MSNLDVLKLKNQLCFPLYAASHLIIRAYQEDLDKLNITYPQYLVLLVLWENDSLTVNELCDKLILNTNTLTPLLKRMESMDLVYRKNSIQDRRKVIISLTDKAKLMKIEAKEVPMHLMEKLFDNMNQDTINEMITLKNSLNKLIHLLKEKI